MKKTTKHKLLWALFAEAKKVGLDAETLREYIAPEILDGKRLSEATPQEVFRVIEHITGRNNPPVSPFKKGGETQHLPPFPDSRVPPFSHSTIPPFSKGGSGGIRKRYESSRSGLVEEIKDLAIERFGEDYAQPLNAFCARFGESDGFRKMRIDQLKAVKVRLLELQRKEDGNVRSPNPTKESACITVIRI